MNTKISEQVKRVAMEMYLNGVPIEEISRKLNLHKNSIHKWKRRGNWESRKEELNKKVEKNVEVIAKEVLERLLRLSKAIQGKFVQTLDFPGDKTRRCHKGYGVRG